ncbi:MAG: DinB family protein [Acidimicrobiales bacterium]
MNQPVARFISNVIDCSDPARLATFWAAMLGGRILRESASDDWVSIRGVPGLHYLGFQRVPEAKQTKNRIHMDVDVASIDIAASAAEDLGATRSGTVVEEPTGWFQVMHDPEGNEFCLILRRNRGPLDGEPVIDDAGRPEPEPNVGETETLLGFLDYQRATLGWKTGGLDAAGMSARTTASTMTLGGILKHMAWVEDHWFSHFLLGRDRASLWLSVDWSADRDWEWTSAASDTPEQLRALWSDSCAASRANVSEVLAQGDLWTNAVRGWDSGEAPSLRWILVHMIEEYARHNGHADLLREALDGETGE